MDLTRAGRPWHVVRDAVHSTPGRTVAVIGLASRGIVYVALSVLVFALAAGSRRSDTDQGSALARLGAVPGGRVVLVLLVVGVACYTVWRLSTAWSGHAESWVDRLRAVTEGLSYLPFGYLAIVILVGRPAKADQGRQYRSASYRLLQSTSGRLLIATIGLTVVIVGLVFCYQGWRRTFADHFDFPHGAARLRALVLTTGTVGSIARGLVFALAGALLIYSAVTTRAREAGGLDAALDALARQPLGTWLLTGSAIGFAAFALFAVAEAIWRDPTKA